MNTESKEFKQNIANVKSIGNKDLAERIKANSKGNLQGAIVGAVIGVVGAVALRKRFWIGALVGGIAGRLFLNSKKK
jgi:hypothetical protein